MLRTSLLFAFLGSGFLPAFSQSFENIKVTPSATGITLTYDLKGSSDETFSVAVFASHDNFSAPLKLVTGDVGKGVRPGPGKTISWNLVSEIKSFVGQLSFELRGLPEVAGPRFRSPAAGSFVRRGKQSTIEWAGATDQSTITLALYKNDQLMSQLGEKPNKGSFSWDVPKDLKTGKDFTLKLTAAGTTVESSKFAVKAKIPLLVKLSPLALLGLIPILFPPDKEKELPFAPDP